MKILVTSVAGSSGSHTLLQLLRERHDVLVFDNDSNSSLEALSRVKQLTNADFEICEGVIQDTWRLSKSFGSFRPEAVIHFAGLNAVREPNEKALEYYAQNVSGSIELLKVMQRYDYCRIAFSS
jgi:UDP-glucose 4-epimerase